MHLAPSHPMRPRLKRLIMLLAALSSVMSACNLSTERDSQTLPFADKVLVIGLPGVTWVDIVEADVPALNRLIQSGAAGNVSVRLTNLVADGYAILGAGARVETDQTGGWAFHRGERVENGTGEDLFLRLNDIEAQGEILLPSFSQTVEANEGSGFNARVGYLADRLRELGKTAVVLGNGDSGRGPLPELLMVPRLSENNPVLPPDVRRDAAWAVVGGDGSVTDGVVSRELIDVNPAAPFGVSNSPEKVRASFDQLWSKADLLVLEPGETLRADEYSQTMSEARAATFRRKGLALAGDQIEAVLGGVDLDSTLVIVVAPTNPGGPDVRGQLRPLLVSGPGVDPGLLTSASTRRKGLVTMQDVGATIALTFGHGDEVFASGKALRVETEADPVTFLIRQNRAAVVNDTARTPISLLAIALEIGVFIIAMSSLHKGKVYTWASLLLLAVLAFPAVSYLSAIPVWESRLALGAAVVLAGLIGAVVAWLVTAQSEAKAALLILSGTCVILFVDLAWGGRAQLDSILGYTSVAGGRFFGLGNLGFSVLTASVLLVAGMLGDRKGVWRLIAFGLGALALVWVGHPSLGGDVGGIITLVPALGLLAFGLTGRRGSRLAWVFVALAALVAAAIFGAIDLARPVEHQTHFAAFITNLWNDQRAVIDVLARKLSLATGVFGNRWGLAIPPALGVLIWLYKRRSPGRWKDGLRKNRGVRAGFHSVLLAAVLGSLFNDSGPAVAGMMLAIAAPWAILIATSWEREEAGLSPASSA